MQQHAEAVDGGERVLVPVAERLPFHLQQRAVQRLGGCVVALLRQQQAEAVYTKVSVYLVKGVAI